MEKIDFVILWVDGNDPEWQREKKKYLNNDNETSSGTVRYRDWELLKYWFRGVEKYAPWVNKIRFVTWGHIPKWLDTGNPKLSIVKHEDFIPKEYLPTFNSNVIQYYLDKIPGITEKFVMFDDDIFILKKINEKDFFIGNKIRDTYGEMPIYYSKKGDKYPHCWLNNMQVVNQYYSKKKVYLKHPFKYFNIKYGVKINFKTIYLSLIGQFCGIYNPHICMAYSKQTYKKLWDLCGKELKEASKKRFRCTEDYSTLLVRYIDLLDGNFIPRNNSFGKRYELSCDNSKVYNAINKQKYKVLCINDSDETIDFEETKRNLCQCFDEILPEKSSFEK